MRLSEVLWDRLCSMSPDRKTVWCMRVCLCLPALQMCTSTWDLCLHQPCNENHSSATDWVGAGQQLHTRSPSFSLFSLSDYGPSISLK